MPSDPIASAKDVLRARCRRYRAGLDASAHARLSAEIITRALSGGLFDSATVVHVYWPAINRREIDTRPLIEHLRTTGKRIVIPAVDPKSTPAASRMTYREFDGIQAMQKNSWGTYEPLVADTVPPAAVDLVVVPALGVDRLGNRLGYGGGFYDRFLKQADCSTLSLVYSECLFDSVPCDDHDVKVDVIVTEDAIVGPGVSATSQPLDRTQ